MNVDLAMTAPSRASLSRAAGLLDPEVDRALEQLVELTKTLLGAPIALITVLDGDIQRFKAKRGVQECSSPASASFCVHMFGTGKPMVVEDALKDERFVDNPLVTGSMGVRAYAGAPIVVNGVVLGGLCVLDRESRMFTSDEVARIEMIRDQVVDQIELRLMKVSLEEQVLEKASKLSSVRVELERARRFEAMGRMAEGVAHDVRNMFGAVLGCALEIEASLGEDSAACREALSDLLSATQRGIQFTEQLHPSALVTQQECGVVVDLVSYMRSCAPMLRACVGAKCSLVVRVSKGQAWSPIAPEEVDRVLSNLVVNARDAAGEGGSVAVELKQSSAGGPHVITVRDDGPGMPAHVAERIFDPYFTTKPEGMGSGLGLATARALIEGAGGSIEVKTAPGEGAVFSISLPASAVS